MALSDKEQRLLEQLEAALAAEDPKLASTLRGNTSRKLHRRRAAIAGVGFLVGIAALVAGMEVGVVVSILGFLVMLVSTIVAISAWQHVEGEQESDDRSSARHDSAFNRFDERWGRGSDDGL